jgi:hypothetical protein
LFPGGFDRIVWERIDSVCSCQAIKSTFTRSDKGDIGAVLELKKNLFKTDFTAKLDHKGTANITAEHNPAFVPGSK